LSTTRAPVSVRTPAKSMPGIIGHERTTGLEFVIANPSL
jgi:hypothetical protein